MSEKFISPVYNVQRVPVEKIRANAYNPNHVAPPEMKLLYKSILEDGYTMPIVCYYVEEDDITHWIRRLKNIKEILKVLRKNRRRSQKQRNSKMYLWKNLVKDSQEPELKLI